MCKLHGLSRNSTASKGFSSPVSCDHFSDLVGHLRSGASTLLSGSSKSGIVIVIKNAEKLRDLDANLLPGFMRLQELTGVNLCVLLQSRIGLSKFAPPSGLPFPISVVLRQYNRDQIASIIAEKLRESDRERGNTVYPDKFYHNYISLVLGELLNLLGFF